MRCRIVLLLSMSLLLNADHTAYLSGQLGQEGNRSLEGEKEEDLAILLRFKESKDHLTVLQ